MKVKLFHDSGINLNNLPQEIINTMINIYNYNDAVVFESLIPQSVFLAILDERFIGQYSSRMINDYLCIGQIEFVATLNTPVPAAPQAVQIVPPAIVGALEIYDNRDVLPEANEEYRDDDGVVAEPECGIECGIEYDFDAISEAEYKETLIKNLRNQDAIDAAGLKVNVRSLNELMSRAAVLEREIAQTTKKIEDNPVVNKLIEDIKFIKEKFEKIENIRMSENNIVVDTKEITITGSDGVLRKIGKLQFVIAIQPLVSFQGLSNNNACPILIFNKDRVVNGFMCGHAPDDSPPCFGSAWHMIVKAISSSDLPALVEILIRFVSNPDLDDAWGRNADLFPRVE